MQGQIYDWGNQSNDWKKKMSEEVQEEKKLKEETDKETFKVEEKVELEKVKHNPELNQKNKWNYTDKRPQTTMDRVFSKIANIKK